VRKRKKDRRQKCSIKVKIIELGRAGEKIKKRRKVKKSEKCKYTHRERKKASK